MSLKSDKWIRRMCVPPEIVTVGHNGPNIRQFNRDPHVPHNLPPVFVDRSTGQRENTNGDMQYAPWSPVNPFHAALWRGPMIEPFEPNQVRSIKDESDWSYPDGPNMPPEEHVNERKIISYGTSSYGYDVRCSNEFKIFTNVNSAIVDPKNFDPQSFVNFVGDVCIIPPNSFVLARTVEYLRIPRNVLTVCLGKSTYARCGIIVNVTPFEPEWEGYVTLEFSNTTPLPAKIYANEGIAQVLFFESDEQCETTYRDRDGKYQGQHGVTLPKV